ncbi:MAG: NAD(P)H-dependent oxidoreductase [Alphaproteobacteria bacterium]|nr:NAD(P)H-dependent oxidoreductase [Alphaproteobacteria bacterium]MBL6939734.1 NAD(P)H-dependent oxidoreductase [Alphaproteobacteria bacterium]MBL7096944.1 NAD(P)H-dependent oxidoreductase [Alphaproteobacteria bacterium]
MIRLLAISGSLRAVSTNTTLLKAAIALAPAVMTIDLWDGLGGLPHFNPDLDIDPLPPAVAAWRGRVAEADGLLISSPEYARGVPGSLKNALDWLVSGPEHPGKPVAFFHASERGVASQAALRLIAETMGMRVIDTASVTIPLLGTQTQIEEIAADQILARRIRAALDAYGAALAATQTAR